MIEFHPLANIFPLMTGHEFEELVSDIKSFGLREPIVRVKGSILDGRNRLRACEKAGVDPSFVDFDGDDALRFVISKNLVRRHLKESQRALVAARLANMPQGGRRDLREFGRISATEAAQLLNVSPRSVSSGAQVKAHAAPSVVEAVERGVISISAADRISRLPHKEQSKLVEAGSRAIVAAARKSRRNHAGSGRQQYASLWNFVDAICDALEVSDLNKAHGAANDLQKEIGRVAASRRGAK